MNKVEPDIFPYLVMGGIGLIVALVILLICREIVCWYWKINRVADTLDEVLLELKKMNDKSRG